MFSDLITIRSSIILEVTSTPSIEFKMFKSFSESENDFPLRGKIFKSGSVKFEKSRLYSFSPANIESTISNAAEATMTPPEAIKLIIFIALLLLLENKYRLAM